MKAAMPIGSPGERVPQVVQQQDERSDPEPSVHINKRIRKKYIPINVNVLGDITGCETVQLAAVGDTEFMYITSLTLLRRS